MPSSSSGGATTASGDALFISNEDSPHSVEVLQCMWVAKMCGFTLNLTQVDATSKDQKSLNPLGKYPLLQTKEGTLAGVVPIVKYMARVSKKMMGANPLE